MKRTITKLKLRSETVRTLTGKELDNAVGGEPRLSVVVICPSLWDCPPPPPPF